jgi:hypothetical protein
MGNTSATETADLDVEEIVEDSGLTWRDVVRRPFNKHSFQARPDLINKVVDSILNDNELNISWLPDSLERQVYIYIIKKAMDAVYQGVAHLHGMNILGHHIELELFEGKIPQNPREGLNFENLHIIVKKLLSNPVIAKNLWFIPYRMKEELFFNTLLLILIVTQIVLGATKCDVLGHTVAAAFSQSPASPNLGQVMSNIDSESVLEYVDEILASDRNIWWLPDVFERVLLFSIHMVVLTLVEEVFADFRVAVVGDSVRFRLKPGTMPNVRAMASIDDIRAHKFNLMQEKKKLEIKLRDTTAIIDTLSVSETIH